MAMEAEDLGVYLQDFLGNLENIPFELTFQLKELRKKDEQLLAVRSRIGQYDKDITALLRVPLVPKASQTIQSLMKERDDQEQHLHKLIQHEFAEARQLCDEKIAIAARVSEMLRKHAKNLDADMERFQHMEANDEDPYALYGVSTPARDGEYYAGYADSASTRKRNVKNAMGVKKNKREEEAADGYEDENGEVDNNLYCFCRQKSYGDMVACDNEECAVEWFHFECVGLTEQPQGSWYCSECAIKIAKKANATK